VQCVSNYYQYLQGRSEKEIRLASADLRKRKLSQGQKTIETDKELVQFLNSVEAKEGRLMEERLKASENRHVLKMLEAGFDENGLPISKALLNQDIEIISPISVNSKIDTLNSAIKDNNFMAHKDKDEAGSAENDVDDFEFYGEF